MLECAKDADEMLNSCFNSFIQNGMGHTFLCDAIQRAIEELMGLLEECAQSVKASGHCVYDVMWRDRVHSVRSSVE